jgi:hypothetical protein
VDGAWPRDAGIPDAGFADGATADAGTPDAARPDASRPDAAHADAARLDANPAADGGRDAGGTADAAWPADAAAPADAASPADAAPARDAAAAPDAGTVPDAGPGTPPRIDDVVAALANPSTTAAAADGLLRDLAWSVGLPAYQGDRWLFATRWDLAPASVSLVGDHNGWSPAARPATRSAAGKHFYAVVPAAQFQGAPAGSKYKWWGTPDTWRAPPEATAYTYDENGAVGFVRPPTQAAWRERFPSFSSVHLAGPRDLRALLPAGFQPHSVAAQQARVLLMHDGQNVFHPDGPWGGWRVDETLAGDPAYADVVVLAVDNAPDRMDAYTHVPDVIDQGGPTGGAAGPYVQALENQVLPFFRDRYGLSTQRSKLMVSGSSLGGLVTLVHAMVAPGSLGCAAALSSTLGWGAYDDSADGSQALVKMWPGRVGHGDVPIYLDSGGSAGGGSCDDVDGDGVTEDDPNDGDNYCVTVQFRDALAGLGYTFGVDLAHWHEPSAGHNEAAWAARFYRALDACAAMGWAAP